MTDSTVDALLEWSNEVTVARDLLRDALSLVLAEIDPESEVFAAAADLYVLTDPDTASGEELALLHDAMVASSAPSAARLHPSPQALSEALQ